MIFTSMSFGLRLILLGISYEHYDGEQAMSLKKVFDNVSCFTSPRLQQKMCVFLVFMTVEFGFSVVRN